MLTGAGISKESGIDTFRDAGGVWSRYAVEDVATPQGFARNPALVHEFYNARRAALAQGTIHPNAAHLALARLERDWPGEVLIVTQNVDDLHDRAGAQRLIHMHGELAKIRCGWCGTVVAATGPLSVASVCAACGQAGAMRPHVVWFGEMPLELARITDALAGCGLFVAIGTSGQVYPAAGFVRDAWAAGALCVELNLEETEIAPAFHRHRHGPATQIVPAFVEDLLAGRPI